MSAPEASAPAVASGPAGRSALPRAFAALGRPCRAEAPHEELCGKDGAVAGVIVPVDHALDTPPDSAEMLLGEREAREPRPKETSVGAEGERLWVRAVTCGNCRRIMGWAFVGDLPRLDDAQISSIQKRLGMPPEVGPLRTVSAWRAQLRAGR